MADKCHVLTFCYQAYDKKSGGFFKVSLTIFYIELRIFELTCYNKDIVYSRRCHSIYS